MKLRPAEETQNIQAVDDDPRHHETPSPEKEKNRHIKYQQMMFYLLIRFMHSVLSTFTLHLRCNTLPYIHIPTFEICEGYVTRLSRKYRNRE